MYADSKKEYSPLEKVKGSGKHHDGVLPVLNDASYSTSFKKNFHNSGTTSPQALWQVARWVNHL